MAGTFSEKFSTATAGFSVTQKATTVAAFAAVAVGVFVFANTAGRSPMAPLYTELGSSDAAVITEHLRDTGINYELTDRGTTVMVPENMVYEARLSVERAGATPDGDDAGFSTLDNLGITSTQFQQRVAFQRGLAAEIETSLEQMGVIDEAQVNLVIPEQDLFTNDSIQASASVMLRTTSSLTASQVTSVSALVAGAVEGLAVEQVTISDQNGTVLSAPGVNPGQPANDFERTETLEASIAADVLAIVEAVAGPGNARVAVNAAVDWSSTSEVFEVYTPVVNDNGEQMRSASSTMVESDDPTTAEGILGAGDVAALAAATTVRADVDANYLVDRTIRTIESGGGAITSLTASVVVDSAMVNDADLATLTSAVAAATGLSPDDGTLAVASLPFDTTTANSLDAANTAAAEAAAVAEATNAQQEMMRTAIIAGLAGVAGLFALLAFRRARKTAAKDNPADRLEALLSGSQTELSAPGRTTPTELVALTPGEQLAAVSHEQPGDVAELITSWMSERTGASR